MKMKLVLFTGLLAFVTINAKPFLYNAGQALSLAISSSTAPQPSSNIADLRKAKSQRLEKTTLPAENSPSFFDDQQPSDWGQNEASPGPFQKKIAKIVAKLQLLSSLSNGFNNGNNGEEENTNTDVDETPEGNVNATVEATTEDYLQKSNSTELESLKEVEEVTEIVVPSTGGPLGLRRFSFVRVLGSFINLAYKMVQAPLYRNNDQSPSK